MFSATIQTALADVGFAKSTSGPGQFTNTGKVQKELELAGWTIKGRSYDLIYSSYGDRQKQDYDGMSLTLFLEQGDQHVNLHFSHYNGTKTVSREIS